MENLEGVIALFIPIAICVILPVLVVWIVFRARINSDNKRAEILIRAIESNNSIDADRLASALSKPRKTPLEILNNRLLYGCIFTFVGVALLILCLFNNNWEGVDSDSFVLGGIASLAVGISFLIVYFVTRGQVSRNNNDNKE